LRLYLAQTPDVHRFGLTPHLATVEWPLVVAMARMERVGLPVSRERLASYRQLCHDIADVMAERLNGFSIKAGSRNSFLQVMGKDGVLAHFVRKDKYSTKEDVLRECERHKVHLAVRPFRLHSFFRKLANSELLAGSLIGQDGRLRCSLEQVGAVSGRITSSNPNLVGLDRRLWPIVAAELGWLLIELDYSQKEVGVAGAEWHDEQLVEQFNLGESYAGVAQLFYADQLTPEERGLSPSMFAHARPELRKKVKNLVLGILYGKGALSIAEDFRCSLAHAETELQRFFNLFPQARDLANRAVQSSLRRGYGLTVTGLRRFIEPGDERLRNTMRNHPIQGSACAIFKRALCLIDGHFRGTRTHLLLPRHDSILLLTPVGTETEVVAVCKILMALAVREKYPQLQPRIKAESGTCWPTDLTLEAYHAKECPEENP
jgi:DNA polymerase-1